MALIQCNPAIWEYFNRRTYGLLKLSGDRTFIRNYKRVLKNGRGLTYFEAVYAAHTFEYQPLFNIL